MRHTQTEQDVLDDPVDFGSAEFLRSPWPVYSRLRESAPVHWSARTRAFLLVRHKDVTAALADRRLATDFPMRISRRLFGPTMLDADGPAHRRMRQMFTPLLGPTAMAGYGAQMIAEVVGEVLDALGGKDFDFMQQVAERLPYALAARWIGLPPGDVDWLRPRTVPLAAAIDFPTGSLPAARTAMAELSGYLAEATRIPRPIGGPPTLLSVLAENKADQNESEFLSTVILFLLAGTETSVGVIGTIMYALLAHGVPFARWRDREYRRAAIQETMRWEPPTHTIARYATTDMEIGGVPIRRHSAVLLSLASANRDGTVFTDPDTWRPGRQAHRSLAFGSGPHTCLGIHLAQAELDVLFERLAERYDAMHWTGAPPVLSGHAFRGPDQLTLHAEPAPTSKER
jgi:cytochrome P450